jgi:hypothetical protein
MNDDFKEELKDCYAEIERLRAALREIASWEPGASAVARQALAQEKPSG